MNCVSFLAAEKGHKDIVEILLSESAESNAKNDFGMTALHLGE
jgi:ankyrin repeat protein